MARPLVHLLTPGDHYSPRTGSAVPTVVDGLSRATPVGEPRPSVLVAAGTYADRYPSATSLEYPLLRQRRSDRYVDAALGRAGLPRPRARRTFRAALGDQLSWPPSTVLTHNIVEAIPLVAVRHTAVVYAHNLLFRTYSNREITRTLDRARAVICVSESLRSQTALHLPSALHERLRVLHNGVDSAAIWPGSIRPRGEVLQVLFVGRMIPDKGADVLVEAIRKLNRNDIHLTLVGGSGFSASDPLTPFEKDIRARTDGMAATTTVRPFVPRAEAAATLATADVVVVPSRWPDPCPLTVLEGMSAGAALVASRIGGIPEQVGDAGLLVEPGDVGALAEVIETLADDAELLSRTRQNCRLHAVENDWSVVRKRLTALLEALD